MRGTSNSFDGAQSDQVRSRGASMMRDSRGDSAKFDVEKLNEEAKGREGRRGLTMKRQDLLR